MSRVPRLLPLLSVFSILLLGGVISLALVLAAQGRADNRKRIEAVRALTLQTVTANYVLCRSSGRTPKQCRLIAQGTVVPIRDLHLTIKEVDAAVATLGEAQVQKLFVGGKKAGAKGDPGPAGKLGETGPRGATGATGRPGSNGTHGSRGNRGSRGAAGSQGPQGVAGIRGLPGPAGPRGPAGPAGLACPAGYVAQQILVRLDPQGGATIWACVLTP